MSRFVTVLLLAWHFACARAEHPDTPLLFAGVGGVYLLADPGELTVDIIARGRNELRAVLVGPDRRVLCEQRIEGDGKARLCTAVTIRGEYAVNVTVANDRYGDAVAWGVQTNCDRYVIETARGHRDRRHEEPIVLRSPGRAADVCFMPIAGPISIDLNVNAVLFDHGDHVIAEIKGGKTCSIPADVPREGLWRLHLAYAKATINIDGLTRWTQSDPNADQCVWATDADAWFPHLENRWLITPCNLTIHGDAGGKAQATFTVHNNAPRRRTITLPGETVTLEPYADREVTITAPVPSVTHITAAADDDPAFSTYATLITKSSPPSLTLDMPLNLRPYEHENQQFGYLPDIPLEWEPYFDVANEPSVRAKDGVRTLRDDGWGLGRFTDRRLYVAKSASKIAYDANNTMYVVGAHGKRAIMQRSTDGGRTFTAFDIGAGGSMEIEAFTGHNTLAAPPPVIRSILVGGDRKNVWRRIEHLDLIIVDEIDGRLVPREPVRISSNALGVDAHSGVPAVVASSGSKTHVIWGEPTDPEASVPGVPTYVVTYDRDERRFDGEPVLIGYGAPPNDKHNRPSIVLDSKGILHGLTGTHNAPIQYAHSLTPHTAHAGWTKAQSLGEGLSQTYIGMVCDQSDTLHVVFRLWRDRIDPHPKSGHAQLAYQRKPANGAWEQPRPLVISPFSEYGIFYQRLNIDRKGRLFLSYDYWSTFWFYRNDHRGTRRSLMMSPDGGDTWKLVMSTDLR